MVAGLGGPGDLAAGHQALPAAPVQCDVPAPRGGVLASTDTRAMGLAMVALGGGRRRAGDRIDPRVGLTQVLPLGRSVQKGQPLARVHAVSQADAEAAVAALQAAMHIDENPGGPAARPAPGPVICEAIMPAPSPRSV